MHFNSLLTYAVAASTVSAALSADEAVKNIENITKQLESTKDGYDGIGTQSDVFSKFSAAMGHYKDAINAQNDAIEAFGNGDIYEDEEQQKLCDTFQKNGEAHDGVLTTIIDKADIIKSTAFGGAVLSYIQTDERAEDSLSFTILDKATSCADVIKKVQDSLNDKFVDAQDAYSA